MASVAATTVLNTAELCEMIFVELDFCDLLHIRQVNHYFRAVIEGSKSLRCKLFLSDDSSEDQEECIPNPLLRRLLKHSQCRGWFNLQRKSGHLVEFRVHHVYVRNRAHKTQLPEFFANMVAVRGHCKIGMLAYCGPVGSNGSMRTRYAIDIDNTMGNFEEGLREACKSLDEVVRSGIGPPRGGPFGPQKIRILGPSRHR